MAKDSRNDDEADEADRVQTNDIDFDSVPGGKEGLRAVRWRCRSLNLKHTDDLSFIKVTPERIYCISVHPSKDKILASAGDKQGSLGFWDIGETKVNKYGFEECQTFMFKAHTNTITYSQYSPTNSNLLFTSSYDGSIRYLDLNRAKSIEAFVDDSYAFSHFDMDPTGQIIYFSTLQGTVGIKDIRQPTTVCTPYDLHNKKVGCVSLNQIRPELMVTSSLDRTMCLWDIRKLDSDCKVQEFKFTNAVTSAYWSPTGDKVVSASYDDLLRVFCYDEGRKLKERVQIPHNNQAGRWVTMFRATWNPNPNLHPHFVVGNMKRSSDVFSAVTGELIWNMRHDTISSIPAVNAFHPKLNIIVTGNAFGGMMVWQEKPKVAPVVLV